MDEPQENQRAHIGSSTNQESPKFNRQFSWRPRKRKSRATAGAAIGTKRSRKRWKWKLKTGNPRNLGNRLLAEPRQEIEEEEEDEKEKERFL